jgi:hypothetical protein
METKKKTILALLASLLHILWICMIKATVLNLFFNKLKNFQNRIVFYIEEGYFLFYLLNFSAFANFF